MDFYFGTYFSRRTRVATTASLKKNAVTLVQSGRTITEVARDLGVSHWSLNRWVKDAEAGKILSQPRTLATERLEQRELRRLRQENLRRQRDILKKPAASTFH